MPLYQEVARPVGVEDMIRLWLDPRGEGDARLEFDSSRRNFRERDRAVLDVLRPHLKRFRRDAGRPAGIERQGARTRHSGLARGRVRAWSSSPRKRDERRDCGAVVDFARDRPGAPRKRLRQAWRSYAYRRGSCRVRQTLTRQLVRKSLPRRGESARLRIDVRGASLWA